MDEPLTVDAAARELDVQRSTVLKLVQALRLRVASGRGIRAQFTRAEIERYKQVRAQNRMNSKTVPPYREPPAPYP